MTDDDQSPPKTGSAAHNKADRRRFIKIISGFGALAAAGAITLTATNQWRILLGSAITDNVIRNVRGKLSRPMYPFEIESIVFAYADAVKQSNKHTEEEVHQYALSSAKKIAVEKDPGIVGKDIETIIDVYRNAVKSEQQKQR